MKKTFFLIIALIVSVFAILNFKKEVKAQFFCNIQVNSFNSATLRGRITDTGGDNLITTWFEWRNVNSASWNSTNPQNLTITTTPFDFSQTLTGLNSCTTYEYKAVARNSIGTTLGNVQCFRTLCQSLTVSCSASPNPAFTNQTVTFNSLVSGGRPPYSYNWSGACSGSGSSCSNSFNSIGTFTTNLLVTDSSGTTASSQCSVNISSGLPTVITLPPVETL